jgi:microcystin-dependent protein
MDNFIGEIRMFAGNYAPQGWNMCDGTLLPIQGNQVLFSLIGTVYGGDGVQNFGLPDLRGKLPVGCGSLVEGMNYVLGGTGGSKTISIDTDELPAHSHSLNALTASGTTGDPTNNMLAVSNGAGYKDGVNLYTQLFSGATLSAMNTDSMSNEGAGQSHANLQPYVCINYIIATVGLYPPQN